MTASGSRPAEPAVKRRAGTEHRAINTGIYEGTNQTRGDGHRLQCRPRWADTHGSRPRWGLMSAGGPTPYPHIALCATAPKSICSRRIGRMRSDVQKRSLPPTATAGPGVIQWPEPGLTVSGTGSNPMKPTEPP
jgi:hypothetical protein